MDLSQSAVNNLTDTFLSKKNCFASVISFLFISDIFKKMNSGHVNLPPCISAKFLPSSIFLLSGVKVLYCPSACCLFGLCSSTYCFSDLQVLFHLTEIQFYI